MPRRVLLLAAALMICVSPVSAQDGGSTEYGGAAGLGIALRKLGTAKRVLMIGAHPDDESTQILSTLALGEGADVAYLSLTRGEGGQNGIGPELQEGLGLLRTEELLAARRLDGARQFFTRAYDFGYSKSAEEAFRHWPRDSLLADVTGVIRAFRPDVIITIFSGTPRDGHGQHQVAGILAREAFAIAGDSARFPEQLARGLRPHQPAHLFQAFYRPNDRAAVRLPTGVLDPLLGQSFFQVAMASRSRHRSQDMGRPLEPGPQWSTLDLVETRLPGGASRPVESLFAGLDTTVAGRARSLLGPRAQPVRLLADYQQQASRLKGAAALLSPGELIDEFAAALRLLQRADSLLASDASAGDAEIRFLLGAEQAQLREALALAAGLVLDAVSEAEWVVPGQSFELRLSLWNGGAKPVVVRSLEPRLPAGWRATALDPLPDQLAPGTLVSRRFRVEAATDAGPTEPYYLQRSRAGDLYRWPDEPALAGSPFEPAPVSAVSRVEIGGTDLLLQREATFRGVDKMQGEFRRPLRVVPHVSLSLDPAVAVIPLPAAGADGGREPLRMTVRLAADDPAGVDGTLRLALPAGWRSIPDSIPVQMTRPGETRAAEFQVHPPEGLEPGSYELSAAFQAASGERFHRGYRLVDYPHTRPRALYTPASVSVQAFEVRLPPHLRVGYVMGAGDDVPEALRQLGIEPELLDEAALASGDLSVYDVIVAGIRAYEVRPDLVAHNRRLLDYVAQGGTMIVQYNKYEYPEGNFAPFPVTMAQPHDRVTDEGADVRLLEPSHPALTWPNRITADDFSGWKQERGLYFLHTWDERFTPLLEMADPGEEPLRGGLLVAPHGEGRYVYTGLSLFRQLPDGVPGAYRLFANLLALGAKP